MLLLRGLIAIAFGVLCWVQPWISLVALVFLFGAYILADGILGVWAAFAGRTENEDWWLLLLWGLVGIGVGILTFMAPDITALALLFYIAIWAIATGVLQIMAAIRLRREISDEWLLHSRRPRIDRLRHDPRGAAGRRRAGRAVADRDLCRHLRRRSRGSGGQRAHFRSAAYGLIKPQLACYCRSMC